MGALDALSACLTTGPLKGKTIEVVGHTDERGDAEYNKQLGYSRAQSVTNYLASKGLDKAKIATISKGQQEATANTNDAGGMAYDRRVDIRLKKLESARLPQAAVVSMQLRLWRRVAQAAAAASRYPSGCDDACDAREHESNAGCRATCNAAHSEVYAARHRSRVVSAHSGVDAGTEKQDEQRDE